MLARRLSRGLLATRAATTTRVVASSSSSYGTAASVAARDAAPVFTGEEEDAHRATPSAFLRHGSPESATFAHLGLPKANETKVRAALALDDDRSNESMDRLDPVLSAVLPNGFGDCAARSS